MNPHPYLCSDLKSYYKNSKSKKVIKSVDFFTKQNLDNYVVSIKHSNIRKNKFIFDCNEFSERHNKNALNSFNNVFSNKTINQESPDQQKKSIKLVQPSINSFNPQTIDVNKDTTLNLNTIRSPIIISKVTIDKEKLGKFISVDSNDNCNSFGKLLQNNNSERNLNSIFKTNQRIKTPNNFDEEMLKTPSSKFKSFDSKYENKGVLKDYDKIFKKTLDHITDIKLVPKFIDSKLQGETIVTKEEDRKKFAKQNITNERLVKIKDSVYFLKGVIDYCFPKIVIDKLKMVNDPKVVNNVSPKSKNLSQKVNHFRKESNLKLGKNIMLEPILEHSYSTKHHQNLPKIKSPTYLDTKLKVIHPLTIRSIFHE
jgi:hypothetical protein